jgi:excisionase family DNA binding protein
MFTPSTRLSFGPPVIEPGQLLTVPQVASEFQVTAQTIRNWIAHGTLPAVRVGRAFRVRRADVDALLERARADSSSIATRRDVWAPSTARLPARRGSPGLPSVWDPAGSPTLASRHDR